MGTLCRIVIRKTATIKSRRKPYCQEEGEKLPNAYGSSHMPGRAMSCQGTHRADILFPKCAGVSGW